MLTRVATASVLLGACTFTSPDAADVEGDPVSVAFEVDSSGADESSITVQLAVVLSAPSNKSVSVRYKANPGTALPMSDYDLDDGALMFEPGETEKPLPVGIVSDADETEPEETFDVVLSNPTGATLGPTATHTVRISNLILPRVVLGSPTTTANENSPSTLAIQLDKAATEDATIEVTITGGAAAPNVDYTLTSGTVVTIPAGQTTATVPIGEINDTLNEDAEQIELELKNPSPNILIGMAPIGTHTITDDDPLPVVQFSEAGRTVNENAGTITLDVTLNTASGRTVTVNYQRDGNDSAADADATVTGSPGTLTFAPGELTKQISVQINNDNLNEDAEAVIVTLSGETNATIGQATHTTTITDDDTQPSVAFQSSTSSANENQFIKIQTINVSLSAQSGKTITLPYSRSGSCNECNLTNSPLVFTPGQQTKQLFITWNDDSSVEGNETVVITLQGPTNASLGTRTVHTFTLNDN